MDRLDYVIDRLDELERRIDSTNNINISIPCFEYDYSDGSNDLSLGKTFTSEAFSSASGSSLLIMCTMDIGVSDADSFNIKMTYDDYVVISETKNLNVGTHSLTFIKAISKASVESKAFTFSIIPQGVHQHTIDNIKYFVWGDVVASEKNIEVTATKLDTKYAVSMLIDNRLLVAEYNSKPSEIKLTDFNYVTNATSAGISYINKDGTTKLVYARIGTTLNKYLYVSETTSGAGNYYIDSNVTAMSIARMHDEDKVIIVYQKSDSKVYYTIFDLTQVETPVEIENLTNIDFKKMTVLPGNRDRMIVLAVGENDYSYMFYSCICATLSKDTVSITLTGNIV